MHYHDILCSKKVATHNIAQRAQPVSALSTACCCLPWTVSSVQLTKLLLEQAVSEHHAESVSHPSPAVLNCLASQMVQPAAQASCNTKLHAMTSKAEHAAWQLLLLNLAKMKHATMLTFAAARPKHAAFAVEQRQHCRCTPVTCRHNKAQSLTTGVLPEKKVTDISVITGTAWQLNNSNFANASHDNGQQFRSQKQASCRQPMHASQPCKTLDCVPD